MICSINRLNNLTDRIIPVSIVMPNYNGELYLREAIESVLNQTFSDFEFIIVDDASTDNSREIIAEYAELDNRIKVIHNSVNQYVNRTANIGLEAASGKYYARIDSDDICLPNRIKRQFEFMESNPDIVICGSYCHIINKQGDIISNKTFPIYDTEIKKALWRRTPIQHSCLFGRREIIVNNGKYKATDTPSEDLEMLIRLGSQYKFANIPEFLVKYRVHGNNIIMRQQKLVIQKTVKLRKEGIKKYNYDVTYMDKLFINLTWFVQFFPSKFNYWLFYTLIAKDK